MMLVLQFVCDPVIDKIINMTMHDDIAGYYRELTRGTFFMLIRDLGEYDPSRWQARIDQLQLKFGFPIALSAMDASTFSDRDLEQLKNGQIIQDDKGDNFYKRVGESEVVLRMGPVQIMGKALELKITVLAWTIAFVFFGVLTLAWAYPFWRKLKRIRTAALAFGQGDFSTRAKLPRRSALAPVAEAFNLMAERIQQLIDSHQELTRAVSHELRTPVARIRFHLEMLTGSKTAAEQTRHIDGIHKDVDELDTMISELLTYARFDSLSPDLCTEAYPLVPWLREIAICLDIEMEGKSFRFNDGIKDDTLTARYDPNHMGRAVCNLLRNAAKYGHKQVMLTALSRADRIIIHVEDDGPGIPREERVRIFEPFARLDDSRSRDSGGYGLGLPIVQRVARWHNGSVTIGDSRLGGACFTLQWPGTTAGDS